MIDTLCILTAIIAVPFALFAVIAFLLYSRDIDKDEPTHSEFWGER